jgi:SAM-dependent methyltransferase
VSITVCLAIGLLPVLISAAADNDSNGGSRDAIVPGKNAIPDVIFIPTPPDVVAAMLKLAEVGENDILYDLGCGDGRIVVAAAKLCGCHAVGCDIDPLRIQDALKNVRAAGLEDRVSIEHKDLFTIDIKPATVVTLYLTTEYNTNLFPKLRHLQPGARVVSHQFSMRGAVPDRVVSVWSKDNKRTHVLYLWTAPIAKCSPGSSSPRREGSINH